MKSANELFEEGYNCAQAVFCAHCEEFGIDFETGLRLSSSFGGGMGRMREVCGALSGLFMLAGLASGYNAPNNDKLKEGHYAKIQELAGAFEAKFGSILCRDLLNLKVKKDIPTPTKRDENFYKTRPCTLFVEFTDELFKKEFIETLCKNKNT